MLFLILGIAVATLLGGSSAPQQPVSHAQQWEQGLQTFAAMAQPGRTEEQALWEYGLVTTLQSPGWSGKQPANLEPAEIDELVALLSDLGKATGVDTTPESVREAIRRMNAAPRN